MLDLGLSPFEISSQVRSGWLERVHRGVVAISGRELSERGHWMAAVLACGESAVLSHLQAGCLWGMIREASGAIHVTVDGRAGRERRPGIRIHRPRIAVAPHRVIEDAIPVTSPAKTMLDLASTRIPRRALERAFDEAERLRLCTEGDLFEVSARPRQPGARRLRCLLQGHVAGSTITRSELEERFLALCRAEGLPLPLVNAPVLGLTVDFFWPAAGLVIEVDGRASHDTRRGFQQDRDRDSRLTASGFKTLRFTWRDVTGRPLVVAQRVRAVLFPGRAGTPRHDSGRV